MSTQVTVTLPDEVYRRAAWLAQLAHRDVADLLADTLARALPPLEAGATAPPLVETLTDAEILALTVLEMEPAQDRRLSALLEKQQAGTLTEAERSEFAALFQRYQEGLLRKAHALHEAVRRGLREPLVP
jgi:hypothetical protein